MSHETDRDDMRELLLQLLDGDLDERAARDLNECLRADARLRADLAELMLQRSHFSQIARELQTASPETAEDRIETARHAVSAPPFSRGWPVAIFASATAAAAAVVLAVSLSVGAPDHDDAVSVPAPPEPFVTVHVESNGDDLWAEPDGLAHEDGEPRTGGIQTADDTPPQTHPVALETPRAGVDTEPSEDEAVRATANEAPEFADPHAPSHADFGRGGYVAYIETVIGEVEFARAGSDDWRRARPGVSLSAADRIKTGMGRARVNFYSESSLEVNRFTQVAFTSGSWPSGISVASGEAFVQTAKLDTGFFIDTPHGRATDLGTEFSVTVGPMTGTTVLVAKGAVEASTDLGTASVGDRSEVTLASRKSAPGQVRKLSPGELARKLSWTKDIPGGREHRYAQPGLAAGLVGYWRFNEGRGAVAYDSSRSALHGKVVGASRTRGYVGGSLLFDGTSDYVRVDLDSGTKFTPGATIAAWIRLDSRSGRAQAIAGLAGLRLTVSSGRVDCAVTGGDGGTITLSAAPGNADRAHRLATGKWYHVAAVSNADEGTLTTYINGVKDLRAPAGAPQATQERVFCIGQLPFTNTSRFDGRIDELCLYRRPLTDSEIRMIAAWPSAR